MTENGGVEVKVYVSNYKVENLRRIHDVPDDILSEELVQILMDDLVWRYFGADVWCTEDIQAYVSDIQDRYSGGEMCYE